MEGALTPKDLQPEATWVDLGMDLGCFVLFLELGSLPMLLLYIQATSTFTIPKFLSEAPYAAEAARPESPPEVSLAQSAKAFMEKRRQAQEAVA